jgi:hypothetical protein
MKYVLLATLLLLAGCDQIKQRAGFVDPARLEDDSKAIGGACRNAGRGLEDCFRLNPDASKAAIYAGWKDMNEYMAKNNMQVIAPSVPSDTLTPTEASEKQKSGKSDGDDAGAEKKHAGEKNAAK